MKRDGVFEDETRLKDLIVRILKEEPASISGVQKRLAQHGENLHRLIVTGYLRAMHDVGMLEATELPPSKVYRLRPGHHERDVYDQAGMVVAALDLPRRTEVRVLVGILERLFHRPIFKEEVTRAGVEPLGLGDWEVETEARQAGRRVLTQAGIQLPHNNPAYSLPAYALVSEDGPELRRFVDVAIEELARKGFQAHQFMQRNKQTTLGDM